MRKFRFNAAHLNIDASDFTAAIPAGISTRQKLFEVLQNELRLPDYFGNNWDALSDSLRDLSWIRSRRVILLHEALPAIGDAQLATYLEVLRDAINDWKQGEEHELIAVFPAEAQREIARTLSSAA